MQENVFRLFKYMAFRGIRIFLVLLLQMAWHFKDSANKKISLRTNEWIQ